VPSQIGAKQDGGESEPCEQAEDETCHRLFAILLAACNRRSRNDADVVANAVSAPTSAFSTTKPAKVEEPERLR